MPSPIISRRQFLILSGLTAVSATLAPGQRGAPAPLQTAPVNDANLVPVAGLVSNAPSGGAPLAIARGDDYTRITRQVIDALGGSGLLARPGERVVIKPSLAWDRPPGWGVNTHPDVLQALITGALSAGAREVTLFDRTACAPTWAYRASGAERMVRGLGDSRVQLLALTEADFVPLDAAGMSGYQVCRPVLEADRIINVGTLRQHPERGVSAGMANLVGLIGGSAADVDWTKHQDAQLVALSAAIRPALSVLDATSSVVRNGPLGNSLADVAQWHTVAASTDPVALDSAGLLLFTQGALVGSPPGSAIALPHLDLAQQFGLGTPIHTFAEPRVIDVRRGGAA